MSKQRPQNFKSRRSRSVAFAIVLAVGGLLAGCKDELYSNLSESEANQMMAILLAHSIATDKESDKTGFALDVDQGDMLRAIAVLRDSGFPKQEHQSIAKIFQKSGIMSSPFEERVRYIYALGQEVAGTLSHIDGVVDARVNIVLPEKPELGQPVKPSSAAVFIKYSPGVDLDYFVPQIKRLVSSSIEGLDYSAVTVVLTEATPMKEVAVRHKRGTAEVVPGVSIRVGDQGRFWEIAVGAIGLIIFLIATNIAILVAWRGKGLWKRGKAGGGVPAVEPS